MFGEKVAGKWIERLPVEQQQSTTSQQLEMIQEEYEQVTTITEELVYFVIDTNQRWAEIKGQGGLSIDNKY